MSRRTSSRRPQPAAGTISVPVLAVSVKQAALAAGIGRSTLWRLIAENKGPKIIKLSGRTLIRAEALSMWLAAMESKAN